MINPYQSPTPFSEDAEQFLASHPRAKLSDYVAVLIWSVAISCRFYGFYLAAIAVFTTLFSSIDPFDFFYQSIFAFFKGLLVGGFFGLFIGTLLGFAIGTHMFLGIRVRWLVIFFLTTIPVAIFFHLLSPKLIELFPFENAHELLVPIGAVFGQSLMFLLIWKSWKRSSGEDESVVSN